MNRTHTDNPCLTLSICIPTLNRSRFIGATLDSILIQLTEDCEVVLLDGGSTDGTQEIALYYAQRFSQLRYIRLDTNNGIDRDCDLMVELARGKYCWLMSDDDLLKPDSVETVLQTLQQDPSLIIVNMERRDLSLTQIWQPRWLDFESDRMYSPTEVDRLFMETNGILAYMCCCVINRKVWLSRDRQRYFGSLFIHVGVMFQAILPSNIVVISAPKIVNRMGNTHNWSSRVPEIYLSKWPLLIASLPLSTTTKQSSWNAEPWNNPKWLLLLRGWGIYSLPSYRLWIRPKLRSLRDRWTAALVAALPAIVVNAALITYFRTNRKHRVKLEVTKLSRSHL